MDVLSEASGDSKLIVSRHISSTEKAFPNVNIAINTTTTALCHSYTIQPDFGTYLAALQSYAWVLWSFELLVLLVTYVLYIITMRSALRHWKQCSVNVGVVLAVYPLVSTAAFLGVVLPRARLLAEAIAQEAVMIAMYHLYSMIVAEFGGPDEFVRRHLSWLRYLVLQMPVVQGILYTLILVMTAEDMRVYLACFAYIQPFIAASILSGMWGVVMTVRAAATAGQSVRPRFFALQLVLVIVKLQCGFAKVLPELTSLPCILPLNPSVYTNLIQNSVMMIEMLLLSIWALHLYRNPPGKDLEKSRQVSVAVLEDNCSRTFEVKAAKEGVENKSYK